MIEMKWLRSRNPGFLVTFFFYIHEQTAEVRKSETGLAKPISDFVSNSNAVLTSWCLLNKSLFEKSFFT
jgi:hypothetical protein